MNSALRVQDAGAGEHRVGHQHRETVPALGEPGHCRIDPGCGLDLARRQSTDRVRGLEGRDVVGVIAGRPLVGAERLGGAR